MADCVAPLQGLFELNIREDGAKERTCTASIKLLQRSTDVRLLISEGRSHLDTLPLRLRKNGKSSRSRRLITYHDSAYNRFRLLQFYSIEEYK